MSEQHAPSFAAWIAEHRNGLADADLSDALRSLVDAVTRYDKAGKLTLARVEALLPNRVLWGTRP